MPSSYSRRGVLGALGTGLLTGLTGCGVFSGRSRTQIGEIVFLNMDDTVHRVRLLIGTDEETVFEATQRVPARSETQPVLTRQDGLPTTAREYTVTARLDDGADSIQRTYPTERGGDCYSVTVRIDVDGTFRDMPVVPNFDGCSSRQSATLSVGSGRRQERCGGKTTVQYPCREVSTDE